MVAFTFTACSKKSEEPPKPKTPKELLSKTWRMSRVTVNGLVDNVGNYSSYRITFSSNGTYRVIATGSPITIFIHRDETGTWELINNNTTFLFDKNTSKEDELPFSNLTETSFSVRFRANDKLNSEYLIEFVPA